MRLRQERYTTDSQFTTFLSEWYSNGIRIVVAVWIGMQRQPTETVNMHIYYLSDELTVELTENLHAPTIDLNVVISHNIRKSIFG